VLARQHLDEHGIDQAHAAIALRAAVFALDVAHRADRVSLELTTATTFSSTGEGTAQDKLAAIDHGGGDMQAIKTGGMMIA
jgi:hypothetical protein